MVEPLHAKQRPAAELETIEPLAPEKAEARKRNKVELMRRQGWEFKEPPIVPTPAAPELSLTDARASVATRIDALAAWLKGHAELESELDRVKAEQAEALTLSRGDRIMRTRAIAEAQT